MEKEAVKPEWLPNSTNGGAVMFQLTGLLTGDTSAEYLWSLSSVSEEYTSADLLIALHCEHSQ